MEWITKGYFRLQNTNVLGSAYDIDPIYTQVQTNTLASEDNLTTFTDSIGSGRFTRFSNPMIEYEYRKGTYFTVWADRFPNLMTSLVELGRNEYFAK